jgi:hypothetical protein
MFHLWRNAVRPARRAPNRRRVRPAIEALEDRTLPANLAPTIFTDGAAGTGSLRDAVLTANSNGEDNVITLQGGTYQLTLQNGAAGQENAAATGDLDLTATNHTIVIQGQGPTQTIIDAAAPGATPLLDRLFQVFPGVTVVLRDLTLRGGLAQDDSTAGKAPGTGNAFGGCILNAGTLTLDDVVVIHNAAIGGNGLAGGPGLDAEAGFAAIGGGIYNLGILNVVRSTIRDNKVQGGSGGNGGDEGGNGGRGEQALGGGLYNGGGTVILTASTLAYNLAIGGQGGNGGDGRALAGSGGQGGRGVGSGLRSEGGTLTLIDSTVAANRATGGNGGQGGFIDGNVPGGAGGNAGDATGGGVATLASQLSFRNSTVAFNTALGGHKGLGGSGARDGVDGTGVGGGVYAFFVESAQVAVSSLFAGNTADTNPDFVGTLTTVDHTLVANGQGADGISNGVNGNIVGVGDPRLGPLADNGGPTLTVALLPGSPALNHGANPDGLATDQRGLPRVINGQVDIGAFEVQVPLPPPPPPPPPPVAQERALVAELFNEALVARKKGPHRLFGPLFVQVSFADTGALEAEFLSPFQAPRYQLFEVSTFNADGDGVANAVLLIASRRIRRIRRTERAVFTPADDGPTITITGGLDRTTLTRIFPV